MKKLNLLFTIFTLLFSFLFQFSMAQTQSEKHKEKLKKAIQRKLLPNVTIDPKTKSIQNISKSSATETNLSNTTTDVEAEVHAAINPLDSNNIVVAAISLVPGSLDIAVYNTLDFGITWNKATIDVSPHGNTILGGGDPVLAYDANGKLYLTWIYLYQRTGIMDTLYADMYWAYSMDGGTTWIREPNPGDVIGFAKLDFGFNILEGAFLDKQWMQTDFAGNLFLSTSEITSSDFNIINKLKLSTGTTFNSGSVRINDPLRDGTIPCSQTIDANGNIYTAFGSFTDPTGLTDLAMTVAKSNNGGISFTSPVKVSSMRIPTTSNDQMTMADDAYLQQINLTRTYSNHQIASDNGINSPFKDNVYIAWNANGIGSKASNGMDIYFSN